MGDESKRSAHAREATELVDPWKMLGRMVKRELALQCTLKRSARIRRGIRLAIGALPLDAPYLEELVYKRIKLRGPAHYFLRNPPDRRVFRDELRRLIEMRGDTLKLKA